MNLLFVCSKNKWRSRTAETIFKSSAIHSIKSAGTDAGARIRLNAKHLAWADVIFAMEKKHAQLIKKKFPDDDLTGKIVVLDIPDEYQYMDENLIQTLKNSLTPYLGGESRF